MNETSGGPRPRSGFNRPHCDRGPQGLRKSTTRKARTGDEMDMTESKSASESGMIYVAPDAAKTFTRALLTANGLSEEHAEIVADCLVRADLRGVDTHGLMR